MPPPSSNISRSRGHHRGVRGDANRRSAPARAPPPTRRRRRRRRRRPAPPSPRGTRVRLGRRLVFARATRVLRLVPPPNPRPPLALRAWRSSLAAASRGVRRPASISPITSGRAPGAPRSPCRRRRRRRRSRRQAGARGTSRTACSERPRRCPASAGGEEVVPHEHGEQHEIVHDAFAVVLERQRVGDPPELLVQILAQQPDVQQ